MRLLQSSIGFLLSLGALPSAAPFARRRWMPVHARQRRV